MLSSATRWRIGGVAGLLFVVISFVASAINVQPPPYTQHSAAIAAWFAENSQQYRVGHFVAGLAFLLFYVPFFAGFCETLRAAEGTPAIWSRVTWEVRFCRLLLEQHQAPSSLAPRCSGATFQVRSRR